MSDTPSGPPQRMTDFFALEAGEYLERLDGALQAPAGGTPAVDELVRLARALRGSALMANKAAIARSAAGVESVVRAVREGRLSWDTGLHQTIVGAVDTLKILIRQAATWTDADTIKAEALSADLEKLAGRRVSASRAPSPDAPTLDAGARAFVAREGAAIASALDRASQALRANPIAHDPLQQVMRALQPLRGLAALNDLPRSPTCSKVSSALSARWSRPARPPLREWESSFNRPPAPSPVRRGKWRSEAVPIPRARSSKPLPDSWCASTMPRPSPGWFRSPVSTMETRDRTS